MKWNMKWICGLFFGVLTPGLAAPAYATPWNSEQPGSVLVFPKFIRGTALDTGVSGQANHAITEFEISVVCPPGETCELDQVVRMRAHWVCPGSSTNPICAESSFNLETTVNGTLYFNPEGVTVIGGLITANAFPSNATTIIPVPPCPRGYLLVWAIDGSQNAIKFNGLIGDAIIRAPQAGFGPTTARAYNAIPIQASEFLATGNLTDQDGDGALDFDDTEYRAVTGRIYGTVRYENLVPPEGIVDTDLTLLTLDVASNSRNTPTDVGLNFYTPDEQVIDVGVSFFCWMEQRLTEINASLTKQVMGRKGLVESFRAVQETVPVTLLGIVETQERYLVTGMTQPGRSFAYWLYNDGNPVPTTFRP
jgi:hypothetical protein